MIKKKPQPKSKIPVAREMIKEIDTIGFKGIDKKILKYIISKKECLEIDYESISFEDVEDIFNESKSKEHFLDSLSLHLPNFPFDLDDEPTIESSKFGVIVSPYTDCCGKAIIHDLHKFDKCTIKDKEDVNDFFDIVCEIISETGKKSNVSLIHTYNHPVIRLLSGNPKWSVASSFTNKNSGNKLIELTRNI